MQNFFQNILEHDFHIFFYKNAAQHCPVSLRRPLTPEKVVSRAGRDGAAKRRPVCVVFADSFFFDCDIFYIVIIITMIFLCVITRLNT